MQETSSLSTSELELVHNAIFTEPDDQTAWWYHRFLLAECLKEDEQLLQVLRDERDLIVELTQEEEQSKWAWLGLHVVLTELDARGEPVAEELVECLDHLIRLDPDRSVRYTSMKK